MSITLVQKNKSKGIMTWSARVPDPHKKGVSQRLEKAERSAREQDNHHYYKIFADGVKNLLEAL